MKIAVIGNEIVLSTTPKFDVRDGLLVRHPKLVSDSSTGIAVADIQKGKRVYDLPSDVSADDALMVYTRGI